MHAATDSTRLPTQWRLSRDKVERLFHFFLISFLKKNQRLTFVCGVFLSKGILNNALASVYE